MVVIMRDAVMPECCKTCVCSEGYGCGITGTLMTTKEMESRPDWCPLEEVEPCEDAVSRLDAIDHFRNIIEATNTKEQYNEGFVDGLEFCISHLSTMPLVTPKAEQRWNPCDWCAYNPPSSMDGKPCTVCPVAANPEPFQKEGDEGWTQARFWKLQER